MKKVIISLVLISFVGYNGYSQNELVKNSQNSCELLLEEIESNNKQIMALKKMADADKLQNKIGLFPSNPEFGFNYLWGDPTELGNRQDISIVQTFDFPTSYTYKSRISELQNHQVDLNYRREYLSIMHQVRMSFIDVVYLNTSIAEMSRRLVHAQAIADAYNSRFKTGDANILEYNKAQSSLLNIIKKLENYQTNRTTLLSDLTAFNGGKVVEITDTTYINSLALSDFEQWLKSTNDKNPEILVIRKESEISNSQARLNSALALPKLSVGYMSEDVALEKFSGITLGITVPLWENKNSVKAARARSLALESMLENRTLLFNLSMRSKYDRAIKLINMVDEFRAQLQQFSNAGLLKKALDSGEISLIEYMVELSLYYENVDQLLQMQFEANKAIAELLSYEL